MPAFKTFLHWVSINIVLLVAATPTSTPVLAQPATAQTESSVVRQSPPLAPSVGFTPTLANLLPPGAATEPLACDTYIAATGQFGTGVAGDLTVASGQTVVVNTTRSTLGNSALAGTTTIKPLDTTGFAAGDEILLHQTQVVNQGRSEVPGRYEFAQIRNIQSGNFILQTPLNYTFYSGGSTDGDVVQVIKVPHYRRVTVNNGGMLTTEAWDGASGGILVFRATESITVFPSGVISVAALGYRGGGFGFAAPMSPNFQGESYYGMGVESIEPNETGGGAACNNNADNVYPGGGGGGGHAGVGEPGDTGQGVYCTSKGGGSAGNSAITNPLFGGGGGAGGGYNLAFFSPVANFMVGGKGGGIALLFGRNITISGTVTAAGEAGGNGASCSGGGGGGAGGSVKLYGVDINAAATNLRTTGGNGGFSSCGANSGGNGSKGYAYQVCIKEPVANNRVYLPYSIRTPNVGLPIQQSFEGYVGTNWPPGWSIVATASPSWHIITDTSHSGGSSAIVLPNGQTQSEILLSPLFTWNTAQLSFWSNGNIIQCRDTYNYCDLKIWLVRGNWGGGDDVYLGLADNNWTGTSGGGYGWGQTTLSITPTLLSGQNVRIGFEYAGTPNGTAVLVDDVSITP